MKKSIDKIKIKCSEKVVSVAIQMYLKKTTKPELAIVAYDAKAKKYICNFDWRKLSAKRYTFYKSSSEDFSLDMLDITPFVEELNREKVAPENKIIMQIENKMFNSWYDDYAMQNALLPLREIHRLVKEGNNAER